MIETYLYLLIDGGICRHTDSGSSSDTHIFL